MTPSFADLGVPQLLVDSLATQGMIDAFPIQAATLPDSLAGRDVLGRGRTGSGKTLAFALPTVARLVGRRSSSKAPRALILVPTRELANQVEATFAPLASAVGLSTLTVLGGVGINPQIRALANGIDIVVATPGRLEDLLDRRACRLDAVEITVLDEADHMADLGFLPAVRRILDRTPERGQRLLFSATLDSGVDVLARRYLHDPVTHAVAAEAAPDMAHHVMLVNPSDKAAVVEALVSGSGRTLAFTRTKHQARKLARTLSAAGVPAVDMHGNLSQAARERNLAAFGDGTARVLVATDIAARGIHVDDVRLVVHVDPPAEHKAYLHRSGRTARAGASGTVVTVSTNEQRRDVAALMRQAAIKAQLHEVRPGHPAIRSIVGPAAPRVAVPVAVAATPARAARRPNRGARAHSAAGFSAGRRSR